MNASTIFGVVLAVVLWVTVGYVFLRYPDFRRALVARWRPEEVARRMDEWAKRMRS